MGQVEIGRDTENKPIIIEYDDKYSFKNYTGIDIKLHIRENKLDGKTIYATCFSQEIPNSEIFEREMTGVTFVNCNLDNVFIPEGNTVIGGSQNRYKVQNDLNDWLIDSENKPTKPFNHNIFTKLSLPMPDPANIPTEKVKEPIDLIKAAELIKVGG